MHNIEYFWRWEEYYQSDGDEQSPFYGTEYNFDLYSDSIYNYYIAPGWDYFGSETLYVKILWADYLRGHAILEFIGEWNDTINNDIMHLKRNVIEQMMYSGIDKFILIGEHVFNFHGSDDEYYAEWFDELENGWIVSMLFRHFIQEEWKKYNLDSYFNYGGQLEVSNWRTMTPLNLCSKVDKIMGSRIELT